MIEFNIRQDACKNIDCTIVSATAGNMLYEKTYEIANKMFLLHDNLKKMVCVVCNTTYSYDSWVRKVIDSGVEYKGHDMIQDFVYTHALRTSHINTIIEKEKPDVLVLFDARKLRANSGATYLSVENYLAMLNIEYPANKRLHLIISEQEPSGGYKRR